MRQFNFWWAKYAYLFSFILLSSDIVTAQDSTSLKRLQEEPKTWPCRVIEEPPTFPGGINAWKQFLEQHVHDSETSADINLKNEIRIQYIINKEGCVTEVKPLDSSINIFSEEMIRVLQLSPRWNPAKRNGRLISYCMYERIIFHPQLTEEERTPCKANSKNLVPIL